MMNGQNNNDDITVVMSTYNGEKFIEEQIKSIFEQRRVRIKLIIRDDGSSDNTVEIIRRLSCKYNIVLEQGCNIGAKNSFYELIRNCPDSRYIAFCDQDDYWLQEKLHIAIKFLKNYEHVPSMYYSNLYVVDENLKGRKKMFTSLSVKNYGQSLTYNEVVGCTLVINRRLLNVVKESLAVKPVCFHDQWISLLCSCVNGVKVADNDAYILYRQHQNNEIGAKSSLKKKIQKSSLCNGKRYRSQVNSQILESISNYIPSEQLSQQQMIAEYRENLKNKISLINSKFCNGGIVPLLKYISEILFELY